jgi:hypothetical protein
MNYTPITPTKKQLACSAIREMFFHKKYNGVVPVADLEVVKHGKQWHALFTKKSTQDAVKELIKEKYINLDQRGDNWLWGGEMHNDLFPDSLVKQAVSRKARGIDCSEQESAEIKMFIKEHIGFIEHFGEEHSNKDKVSLINKVQELFPIEFGEALDEAEL